MTTISVCIGSACHLKGSYQVVTALQNLIAEWKLSDQIEIKGTFCLKHCTKGVSVMINEDDSNIFSVSADTAAAFFEDEVLPRL